MAAPFARPCGFPDTVVLVSFYNTQAPGLRLLQALLERAGYQVSLFFYENKGFHPPSAPPFFLLALGSGQGFDIPVQAEYNC